MSPSAEFIYVDRRGWDHTALMSGAEQTRKLEKLKSLPAASLLAPRQPFERLEFERLAPAWEHRARLRFVLERAGQLRGFALTMQALVNPNADADDVDFDTASPFSHWNVPLLRLPEPVPVKKGQVVVVHCEARLGREQPIYMFDVWIESSPGAAVLASLGAMPMREEVEGAGDEAEQQPEELEAREAREPEAEQAEGLQRLVSFRTDGEQLDVRSYPFQNAIMRFAMHCRKLFQ